LEESEKKKVLWESKCGVLERTPNPLINNYETCK
jgi:hypothetical protein